MDTTTELEKYIDAGAAEIPADLVIENGTLINVDTAEYYRADVAIYKGRIVAVDKDVSDYVGEHTRHVDATDQYLAPGLIDGHIHVECSKMSMTRFAQAVVPKGTTSIVSGLDEYISVIGLAGLDEIFAEIDQLPLKVFWGVPYKTPYTIPQSTVAYNVSAQDHQKFQPQERSYGVWETVREAVQTKDKDTLSAVLTAQKLHKPIFGCSPMAKGKDLNQFLMTRVRVDHESYSHEEFLEKARKGIHTIIRESSVTKFLAENVKAITEGAPGVARHTSFCTDDVTARDILEKGHVDHLVRLAIKAGISPMTAIQMATLNSAEAYHIDDQVGSIAPGKEADILLIDQPGTFNIETVISKGVVVVERQAEQLEFVPPKRSVEITNSVKCAEITAESFKYQVDQPTGMATVRSIKSVGPFVRKSRKVDLKIKDGCILPDAKRDVALVSVVERYGINHQHSRGFISGWGLQSGAIATSASPDDNNIVVAGMDEADMALAVNELVKHGGGQVVVNKGEVLALLELPVAGIVTDLQPNELARKEVELKNAANQLGCKLPDPLFYLSFLPITAIPDLAITDGGNVDYTKLEYFDPILDLTK
ncbi:amidohydrolase family protein [Pediococcus acidilactici]|uniref:adenine deaminase C-terminal domain-containing protein n=1 Tax=Pediococcus acidilactici TaxID=1254 RepID=UPI0013250E0D|nr:adenine deaminase C-terminal domain-containing protein [Pediococcus acidilactici]KAF0371358.1 amidohydrolase family protein [Pediococcus acidilactici]KAF0390216.1 amidohydrolase family protein [Pediococcus acidilactici]